MKGFKKRQITMWALLDLPDRMRRKIDQQANTSTNEQGRPLDRVGQQKGPEVAPGREGRQRGS
jgi:hypothetical protein